VLFTVTRPGWLGCGEGASPANGLLCEHSWAEHEPEWSPGGRPNRCMRRRPGDGQNKCRQPESDVDRSRRYTFEAERIMITPANGVPGYTWTVRDQTAMANLAEHAGKRLQPSGKRSSTYRPAGLETSAYFRKARPQTMARVHGLRREGFKQRRDLPNIRGIYGGRYNLILKGLTGTINRHQCVASIAAARQTRHRLVLGAQPRRGDAYNWVPLKGGELASVRVRPAVRRAREGQHGGRHT